MRVGMGYDVHRLTEERPLILGGVEIPYDKGLLGHSDADVLLHAIIGNIDATIIAQRPKMAPHIPAMRENVARALKISADQINIKATTEEGLGFTGTGEGISSQAVCALIPIANYAYEDVMAGERDCGGCGGCRAIKE